MKTTNHKMITIKKNSKTKRDMKADQITKILAHVSDICDYVKDNLCSEQCQFEELEEMLWKLAR